MHDVITKTLPANPMRDALAKLFDRWGDDAALGAGSAIGMLVGQLWTVELIAKADAHLQTLAATKQDTAMLDRDEPKAKPAAPAEDPLEAVRAAIQALRDEMFECALAEVQNAGRLDPDYARADDAEAALVNEVKRLLLADRMAFIASVQKPTKPPATDNGLLTSHNPDRRGVL